MDKATPKLGDRVRDRVTGFEGIVVCETQWLHGCRRLTIQAQWRDGKPGERDTFDEPQIEILEAGAFQRSTLPSESATGGDAPAPSRLPDPVR